MTFLLSLYLRFLWWMSISYIEIQYVALYQFYIWVLVLCPIHSIYRALSMYFILLPSQWSVSGVSTKGDPRSLSQGSLGYRKVLQGGLTLRRDSSRRTELCLLGWILTCLGHRRVSEPPRRGGDLGGTCRSRGDGGHPRLIQETP